MSTKNSPQNKTQETSKGRGELEGNQKIGVVGDLLTDVVIQMGSTGSSPKNRSTSTKNSIGENIRHGTDTPALVEHRRGGSAANLAVAAAKLNTEVVFIGNVGDDVRGSQLLAELEKEGIKCAVTRSGTTGTVVALLSPDGERSMITDRGASKDLKSWEKKWLADLKVLHIPGYSLIVEPLGAASLEMIAETKSQSGTISIGISSVGAVQDFGVEKFWSLLEQANPDFIICNSDEAQLFEDKLFSDESHQRKWVVTGGVNPTRLYIGGEAVEISPLLKDENFKDTTGAGDAFSAGFLVGLAAGKPPEESIELGHKSAYDLLVNRQI